MKTHYFVDSSPMPKSGIRVYVDADGTVSYQYSHEKLASRYSPGWENIKKTLKIMRFVEVSRCRYLKLMRAKGVTT